MGDSFLRQPSYHEQPAFTTFRLFPPCKTRKRTALLPLLTHLAQFTVLQLGPYIDHNAFYDSLVKIIVLLLMIPALGIALTNLAVIRRTSLAQPDVSRNSAFASRTEAMLLFLLLLSLLLQWWMIYGQW